MTDISFSEAEMFLLQKGPKYSIHKKHKNYIQNLAIVAETAISHLPLSEREDYRKLTAERINTLKKNNKPSHTHTAHTAHTPIPGPLRASKQNSETMWL